MFLELQLGIESVYRYFQGHCFLKHHILMQSIESDVRKNIVNLERISVTHLRTSFYLGSKVYILNFIFLRNFLFVYSMLTNAMSANLIYIFDTQILNMLFIVYQFFVSLLWIETGKLHLQLCCSYLCLKFCLQMISIIVKSTIN